MKNQLRATLVVVMVTLLALVAGGCAIGVPGDYVRTLEGQYVRPYVAAHNPAQKGPATKAAPRAEVAAPPVALAIVGGDIGAPGAQSARQKKNLRKLELVLGRVLAAGWPRNLVGLFGDPRDKTGRKTFLRFIFPRCPGCKARVFPVPTSDGVLKRGLCRQQKLAVDGAVAAMKPHLGASPATPQLQQGQRFQPWPTPGR